ncbi:MAG: glycine cleavage system protein H [Casimicrobiaceae bacterium]
MYDVENHIWFREVGDGNVKLGMTTVATAMAGQLVAFTPKKVGRAVQAGKSCATVESGKWVGPAKSAAGGEIAAVNDDVVNKPSLANEDPYGAGWLIIIKPEDWAAVKATLTPGTAVAAPYEAKMAADGFAGCACTP